MRFFSHPRFVVAAFVCVLICADVSAVPIVIDNGDFGAGYATSGIKEQPAAQPDAFGGDQAFNEDPGNLVSNATYTFGGLATGTYEVFASWRLNGQGNTDIMKVAVSDGGPTANFNQRNVGPVVDLVIHDGTRDINFQKVGEVVVGDGELVVTVSLGIGGAQNYFINDAIAINQIVFDTDGDGMPDDWEEANGLNKLVDDAGANADADSLTNLEEFQRGTDPQDEDSDDDGLLDHLENGDGSWTSANDTGTDPNNPDTDGDGLFDGVENNTGVWVSPSQTGTDPHRADSDNDGLGDELENPEVPFAGIAQPGTDPNDPDSDGDGYLDGIEIYNNSDPTLASSVPVLQLTSDVVINEVHYNPANEDLTAEFIEIHNRGVTSVDMTGWRFSDGVMFTFPQYILPPGGYVVVAENPATVSSEYGASALGPWVGKLSNEGERIVLEDNGGVEIDRVDYDFHFPWPTAAGGEGPSMELVSPFLDNDLGGSWRSSSVGANPGPPSPGARNTVFASNAPPQIRQVAHLPQQPTSGQEVVVSAKVTDPGGVSSVNLEYQLVEPGSYIRATDAAYQANWTSIPMRDDGTGSDAVAGDSTYTVALPASLQVHRRLVRYRIVASDLAAVAVTVPYADDRSANFAYFCYDGAPAWQGAYVPGTTPNVTYSAALMNSMPIYHLIADAGDVVSSQYNQTYNDGVYRWEGALVYNGEVYDHIHYRIRGAASTYNTGKNKWKLRFNRGRYFQGRDDYGEKYKERVRTLNWSALASPWNPANRGMAGLDEAFAFKLWEHAGIISRNASYFHLRIIDGAQEQNPTNQFDGDNWGLYLAIDQADRRFLDEQGLPDGNTFNMHFNQSRILNEAAGQPHDRSDLFAFTGTGSDGYNRSPLQPQSWWEENVDVESYFSYRAVVEAVNHSDLRDQANSNLYHNPVTGKWTVIPWDVDLLYERFDRWGPNAVQTPQPLEQFRKCLGHAELNIRFQNRARELQDLLLNNDQGWTLVDEMVSILGSTGGATGWPEVDAARWNKDPRSKKIEGTGGNPDMLFFMDPYTSTRFPQHSRTLSSADFAGMVDWVKDFMVPTGFGGGRLAAMVVDTNIPVTPSITYTGGAGFPTNELSFESSVFTPGVGGAGFAAMEWRIGEIYHSGTPNYVAGEPWRYEVDSFWSSGALTTFSAGVTIPPIAVREGHRYRARVRHLGVDGRWSHWSAPVEFTATAPNIDSYLNGLVVSEVMYKPGGGGPLEFIEIKNVGPVALDLTDIRFTKGIDFNFAGSSVTSLQPGSYALVVEHIVAFEAEYGNSLPVAGEFAPDKLSNGGERLKLSFGAGTTIRDFIYDDVSPWPTLPDDSGHSLVLIDPESVPLHSEGSNWRSSASPGGNPGASDAIAAFVGNAAEDNDFDGLGALLEHGFGGDDSDAGLAPWPVVAIEGIGPADEINDYLVVRVRRNLAAEDVVISAEVSSDLINWSAGPSDVVFVGESSNGDGTSTLTFRSAEALETRERLWIRVRVESRR